MLAKENAGFSGPRTTNYTYNALNQLISSTSPEGVTTTYTYDGSGARVSKTTNGTTTKFYWDRGYVVNEATNGTINVTNFIGPQGIFGRKAGTATADSFIKNAHGDVTDLTNRNVTYDYDAYGNLRTDNMTDSNPFRYCGEYQDSESGLIYLRNRYYDPTVGRFINEDPIKDGTNWYAYCGNNPIAFVDPSGLDYDDVIANLSTIVNAKARMLSASKSSMEYRLAYQNAMQAKERISNDIIYVENHRELRSILSPIIEGDNNSLQSLKDARSSVETAKDDYNRSQTMVDVATIGVLAVGGAVAIKAGAAAVVSKLAPVTPAIPMVDPNKINHIFNKAEHNLYPLVQKFRGNLTDAYIAVQNATQSVVNTKGLNGVFDSVENPIVVNVKGFVVNVGGRVVDGIIKIGTFYIE